MVKRDSIVSPVQLMAIEERGRCTGHFGGGNLWRQLVQTRYIDYIPHVFNLSLFCYYSGKVYYTNGGLSIHVVVINRKSLPKLVDCTTCMSLVEDCVASKMVYNLANGIQIRLWFP